jgi:hypothetical protein
MLIGHVEADGVVVVRDVTGPLATDERDSLSMWLNIDRGLDLKAAYMHLGVDLRLCGDWHVHPITKTPSEGDRSSWRSWVEDQGRPWWVSLILGADLQLRCWVTADDNAGRVVTRRLPLEVEEIRAYTLPPTVGDRGLLAWKL